MADQDFKINIVTLADLTGIKLTQQELDALQTAAAQGNKQAISALKQLETAQKAAETAQREANQEMIQGIRAAAGYGLIVGGSVAAAISRFAAAQNKVTEELEKQGDKVVELAQKWHEAATMATSLSDIGKIAGSAAGAIDTLDHRVKSLAGTDLSPMEQSLDFIYDVFATGFGKDEGPFAKLQNSFLQAMAQQAEELRKAARKAIEEGEAATAAFEARKLEPYEQAITEINGEITKTRNEQLALNHAAADFATQYDKAANKIAHLRSNIDELTRAEQRRQKAAEEAAKAAEQRQQEEESFLTNAVTSSSLQTKAVLENEQAARQAREAGDEKSARMYQTTADQLKKSMTQVQREEYESLQASQRRPVGRKAGVGESQDLVDDVETQRLNADVVQHGGKPMTKEQWQQVDLKVTLQDILTELKQQTDIWRR